MWSLVQHSVYGCIIFITDPSSSVNDCILSCIAGLNDLKAGVIRTPLPSKDTFLDDPLRVMRALRFGESLEVRLQITVSTAFKKIRKYDCNSHLQRLPFSLHQVLDLDLNWRTR